MHFVTGGAFNGKRKWVKETYQLDEVTNYLWLSAYEQEKVPKVLPNDDYLIIILEGIEYWIRELIDECNDGFTCRAEWQQLLNHWLAYEQGEAKRKLIMIGSDITKGIVPLDETLRLWRDVTGWVYQDLTIAAQRVDLIWCGISTRLK